MAEHDESAGKAPYNVTWSTFVNTLEKMNPATVPNRLDPSYLTTMAGGTRVYFLAAMRFFGLVDENHRVLQPLRDLVSDPETRRDKIGGLLRAQYPFEELASTNATADELLDAIKQRFGSEGETARKQMSFYLQGCRWAGLELSPNWPIGKPGGGSVRGSRKNVSSGKVRRTTRTTVEPSPVASGPGPETRTVSLPSGMTLTLTASKPLLTLPHDELANVLDLVKAFDTLADQQGVRGG